MRIERIELENWMPFGGRQILDLPGGPIAVVARYEANPRRSNWAGKTALLEAIEWALYGLHRKRYEDDVIHGEEPCTEVTVVLSDGSRITRRRARGKATVIKLRDAEGVTYQKKAAADRIAELVGFDATDYRATVGFAQGDTEAIVGRTSGERRKIVGAWLGLDAWLRVAARARADAKIAAEIYREAAAAIRHREEDLETGPSDAELCERINDARVETHELETRLAELETRLEAVAAREIARQDSIRLERVLADLRSVRAELTKPGLPQPVDRHAAASRLEDATADYVAAETEMTAARALVRGKFDGRCPVTCEACPVADVVRGNSEAARTRFETARNRYEAASSKADEARAAFKRIEAAERHLERFRTQAQVLGKQAKELRASIAENGTGPELSDADVQALRADRSRVSSELVEAKAQVRHLETMIRDRALAREAIAQNRAELAGAERELRIANLAARAVGPTGIPTMIAETALADLEERANMILQGSGLSFTFSWDRETRDPTPSCYGCGYAFRGKRDKCCPACDEPRGIKRADELEILVRDGSGAIEDVRAKSGGAKVLVASAIRLTAGMMLRETRAAPCAWATVDEPFGPLDSENRLVLAQTFAGMLGTVGLEQAFVVSHDAALLDALPARLEIVREGPISRVTIR